MAKSLEERIRALEDVNEIRRLMSKYIYTMDRGDWEGVMSCYARECSADFGSFGGGRNRAEVESFYRNRIMTQFSFMFHVIGNESIEVKDERTATGRWYLLKPTILQETKRAAWLACAYYVDFLKEDGKWLFRRVMDRDGRFVTDYDKGWAREPFTVDPGSLAERMP